jgi:hypothetical protein
MLRLLAAVALAALATACPGSGKGSGNKPDPQPGKSVTVFALAELRGQIEPCGCTTDPLGDLARTAHLVADARSRGGVVVVDAGSLLYSQRPVPDHLQAQEELKAALLVGAYADPLQVAAIGLGPMDLARGPGSVRPARHAANVPATAGIPIEPPGVIEAGGVRLGVFGVVSAEMAPGIEVGDPEAAARQAVATLARERAEVVVALLSMSKRDAVRLLGAVPGIDVAILGMGREQPEPDRIDPRAESIDGAWLVVPANRGQVVSRIEIVVRDGDGPLVDAVGPAAAAAIGVELDARIDALERELAAFDADPSADPAFVAQRRAEAVELRAERQRLAEQPLRIPARGSYYMLDQVRIRKGLACDLQVQTAKQAYSHAAGEANVAAAAGTPVPEPPAGKAGYVGVEECEGCHAEAVAFWNQTRHAGAWETLERIGKQFDYDCTSCHVTGWDQPGGATMAFNEPLRDVQCEVCHGPGSLHAEAETEALAKKTILREASSDLCATQCHTRDHSDTFELEAYLRDIVGPGHGEARRKALGDGPTGRELRAAGLERAGKTLGAGCVK